MSQLPTIVEQLERQRFTQDEIARVRFLALTPAKLAGMEARPFSWMRGDHPARVNLILEQLGRSERITE